MTTSSTLILKLKKRSRGEYSSVFKAEENHLSKLGLTSQETWDCCICKPHTQPIQGRVYAGLWAAHLPSAFSPAHLGGTSQRKAVKKGNSLTSHNYLHLYTKRRELPIGTSSKHLPWDERNEGSCMNHCSYLHITSTIKQFNLITNYLKPPCANF